MMMYTSSKVAMKSRTFMIVMVLWGIMAWNSACSDDSNRANIANNAQLEDVNMPDDHDSGGGSDTGGGGKLEQPEGGPGAVLDVNAAHDLRALGLQVSTADSRPISVSSVGSSVYKIEYSFRSQTIFSSVWTHDVTLFVPMKKNPSLKPGAFVILQHGTSNEVDKVSSPAEYRVNYAAMLTAVYGIPSLVVTNLPGPMDLNHAPLTWKGKGHASCYGPAIPAARYTSCLLDILRQTDDATADPFRYIAFGWMRAVTAAVELSKRASSYEWENDEPVEFELSRAVILAEGERAVAARMAAAVDTRIDGVFGASADFGALDILIPQIKDVWHRDYGWFGDIAAFETWIKTDAGKAWQKTVDPVRWPEMIAAKSFVNAAGTNDPNFPLQAYSSMEPAFGADTNRYVAKNYGTGFGTQVYLSNWMAFVAHVYLGYDWLKVDTAVTSDRGNVAIVATTSGGGDGVEASVSYVQQHRQDDDTDFRDTNWSTESLRLNGKVWEGDFAPIVEHVALVSEVIQQEMAASILEGQPKVPITGTWSSPTLLINP